MATNPKNNEWIYGTQANYVRTQRERRDDAIRNATSNALPLPKNDYSIKPIVTPRSISPSLPALPSTADAPATPWIRGGQARRPRGRPIDLTKTVALIGGIFGAFFAAAHGANSTVGMGISFFVSFVVAAVLFHYAKWVLAVVFLAGVIYALTH